LLFCFNSNSQNISVARAWNDLILEAIRNDYARPTVHARNLLHHSVIAYDAWAAYDPSKKRYFLGDTLNGYICSFDGVDIPLNVKEARKEAIAYASFRFIQNRYNNSPNYTITYNLINNLMQQLGYDPSITSTDYINGGPAELGNYLAEQIQLYGLTDGSNEAGDYANTYYDQANPPIIMSQPGNPDIVDPNRWQPITLATSIDQAGNPVLSTPPHLSPEWGDVHPFSLDTTMYTEKVRDGDTYKVYFDTVTPAYLNMTDSAEWDSFYKWNHTLVTIWQSHLDPTDGVNWDISPASIGNNTWYPDDSTDYPAFYDLINGGDPGTGYALNPVTGMPYTPQIVPRGDYARVLAEFWADGIDSETPPGHWFEIYHYVTDQPTFERKWQGVGPVLDTLEFDVKAHLALGGTMHDAAISAWSLKGYYDYIRPVSAIRYMADMGQSTDTLLPSYDPNGIPLLPGYVELVQVGDPLAGTWNEHVGKIKLFTWKGHDYINDPLTEVAGVGWILAENWWPYQRPTFVTPPFAGFVSGHSTFSRAASITMEMMTGSPYFPGGLGEFQAVQNQYLHFEDGPSTTITLQWASYKDAADQCSLSRLWGGIHPPIDDIPGRKIGEVVGPLAFNLADSIYSITNPAIIASSISDSVINIIDIGNQFTMDFTFNVAMDTVIVPTITLLPASLNTTVTINQINWIDSFNVEIVFDIPFSAIEIPDTKVELSNMATGSSLPMDDYTFSNYFIVDTKTPLVENITPNYLVINDNATTQSFIMNIEFDEPCDQTISPLVSFSGTQYLNPTLTLNAGLSGWTNDTLYKANFSASDFDEEVDLVDINVSLVEDANENVMTPQIESGVFIIDTRNPSYSSVTPSDQIISQIDLGSPSVIITADFDEAMNTSITPIAEMQYVGAQFDSLVQNMVQTTWTDTNTLSIEFSIYPNDNDLQYLDLLTMSVQDEHGNFMADPLFPNVLISDMKSPEVTDISSSHTVISDSTVGSNIYYTDVTFSEPMDTMIIPLVTHQASQSITGTIQYNLPISHYLDSTTFRAYYQVIDQGIEVDPVHIAVDYGEDFVGNAQVAKVDSNFTRIDTKNPTAIGIYSNDYVLNQLSQPFDVIAIFDENMYAGVDADLEFTPVITLPTDLSMIDSFWVNPTTFEFHYELLGAPTQTQVFDIRIVSAVDEAGNLLNEAIVQNYLTIEEVLGLINLDGSNVKLYPTLLASGATLNLIGIETNEPVISLNAVDLMGQMVQEIRFELSNGMYKANNVRLEPGMYFLRNSELTFNIVVTE
jgi:hypothetical protein